MKPIAALLGAGMLALTLAGNAFAQDGHPTPISDTSPGISVDCTGGPGGADITPGAGQVAWVFVHSNPDSQSGVLTAIYTEAGTQHANSYIQGGVKYLITTNGPDTITAFSDTISGGELVLSHVCYGATTTTTTTSSTTSSQTTSSTTASSTTSSETTTASSTTSSETTSSTTASSTTSSETTGSTTTSSTTSAETTGTTTTTDGTTTTSTPSGSVLGETGSPTVTPPATDAVSSSSRTPSGAWNLVLTLGIVLTLSILVLTPMAKARRK